MIVVIFEVTPKDGAAEGYLDLAAALRPELERIDGFISVERFTSLARPGTYLSLSFWRDEAAVATWRRHAAHAEAQRHGKSELFADFRITVAETRRSYTLADRAG